MSFRRTLDFHHQWVTNKLVHSVSSSSPVGILITPSSSLSTVSIWTACRPVWEAGLMQGRPPSWSHHMGDGLVASSSGSPDIPSLRAQDGSPERARDVLEMLRSNQT